MIKSITYRTDYIVRKLIVSLIVFALAFSGVFAQAPPSEYKVKAIFLYNFTRFIDWPTSAFNNESRFVIGILGQDPFGNYIEEAMLGENVAGRNIVIERYDNIKDLKNCHLLFINIKNQERVKEVLKSLEGKKTLTVSELPDFVKWGGMIRIYSDDNKIRMQINDKVARNHDIKISAKLLNVAEVYYP